MANYRSISAPSFLLSQSNYLREDFFIKTFAEKLNLTYPFFLQARVGTVFSCIKEIKLYLNSFDYSKNSVYIDSGVNELIEIIDNDDVIKEYLKDDWAFYKTTLKLSLKDLSSKNLLTIDNIISIINKFKDSYEKDLIALLRTSIFDDCDSQEKIRSSLSKIEKYTSKYIEFLIDSGFSHLYLFNRLKYFTQKNNYSKRNFQQQFDYILHKLSNERSEFSIYFLISEIKNIDYDSLLQNYKITTLEDLDRDELKEHLDKLPKLSKLDKYLEIQLHASDYMAASFIAKKNIDKALDISLYSTKRHFNVSDICIVRSHKGPKATHSFSLIQINKKVYKEESLYSNRYKLFNFNNLIDNLQSSDKSQILQSLRYIRLTREINSNEQKILNLWISLESLFFWKDESSILAILMQYVPSLYAQVSIAARLNLAVQIAKKCNISIFDRKENSNLNNEDILEIFSKDELSQKVFNNLNDEFMKYRWLNLNELFKSEKNIFKQMENTALDVSRQIRRIYFLRNKISHTGYYSDINPILTLHLMDYVQICYIALNKGISECLKLDNRKYSFEEIFNYLDLKNKGLMYKTEKTSRNTLKKLLFI